MENNEIKIVIGSWGSYNECNERALGSQWLTLSDYSDWEEIEKELKKEGFILNGIDEELFIQDIEGIEDKNTNWDYENPQKLFEYLQESDVLTDDYKYEVMQAYLEVRTLDDWKNLVDNHGSNWDCDITLYKNKDRYDLGYELLNECHQIPDYLDNYIDYEKFGEELRFDGYEDYSEGIIAIYA